ncbi:MAG: Thiol-disulfide oxidoreductase ResA [Rhodocyclaceae bacterium]|nr:Thiol-disulfide oxidoreductase ResA [Rhodocyclaceae bacterium]CAG0929427.1 glutathione peroxidase [Rhodocyclaceae bacterium]
MRFFLLIACLVAAPAWAQSSAALFAATLHDFDDRPFAFEQLRGKPLIVNFWARWCGPCRKEIPELAAAHDKYGKRGLVVVGIALDDKVEATKDFAKAYEMRYTGLLAKEGGIALMQATGNAKAVVPFTLVIDRQGKVIGSKLGAMNHAEIEAAASQLLGAK